jgi:hypothetical protein
MADDARISTAFPQHPKTKLVRKRLGFEGTWALVCLILWVANNKADGDLAGMSDEEIEVAVDWGGKDGDFIATLKDVRFLDGESGSYTIHDWAEHNPYAATRQKRVDASKEANRIRWEREREVKGLRTGSEPAPTRTKADSPPPLHSTTKSKPSAKSAETDSRHTPISNFIKQCITHATKLDPAPWSGRDGKSLSIVLQNNPSWDVDVFKNLIRNRFRSDVPRGDPAYKWLPELSKYAEGPLDQYGKPQVTNGTNQRNGTQSLGKQDARNTANHDAILAGVFGIRPDAGGNVEDGVGTGQDDFDRRGSADVEITGQRLIPRNN